MSGFRNFILKGDLVSLAVAFIMGGAFATVVSSFVVVIMDLIGKAGNSTDFSDWQPGHVHLGAFITAVIAFIILAAVVYFFVVVPYTKAKDRFFPTPVEAEGQTVEGLLVEIRDALQNRA